MKVLRLNENLTLRWEGGTAFLDVQFGNEKDTIELSQDKCEEFAFALINAANSVERRRAERESKRMVGE